MSAFLVNLLVAQGLWARLYDEAGGASLFLSQSMIQTPDSGFLFVGTTEAFGSGGYDIMILKLDAMGNISWAKTYGGATNDYGWSVINTSDGGFAMSGIYNGADPIVMKLDASGGVTWARTYGGTNDDRAYSLAQTADGGFAFTGLCYSFSAGWCDIPVFKLDASGNLLWARTYGGTNMDVGNSIIPTPDGGVAVAGGTLSFGAGGWDFIVLKIDAGGSLSWARTYGEGAMFNYDNAQSIVQTTDGGFAVTGPSMISSGDATSDFLVIKTDASGTISWARTYGGTDEDWPHEIIQTTDGGFAIAAGTQSFGAGGWDFLTVKLDGSGNPLWARTIGGTGWDEALSVVQCVDGGFAVSGYTQSYGGGNDLLVLRLDGNGNYPDCVSECSPTAASPTPTVTAPPVGATCSPTTGNLSPTVTTPTITVTDVCPPLAVGETGVHGPWLVITCSPVSGGALFLSSLEAGIMIYSVDGRVAYLGKLQKGENRINLETGVYFWKAGDCGGAGAPAYPVVFGKAVVR